MLSYRQQPFYIEKRVPGCWNLAGLYLEGFSGEFNSKYWGKTGASSGSSRGEYFKYFKEK